MSCPKCGKVPLVCDGCKREVFVSTPDGSSPWQIVDGTIVDANGLRIASSTYRLMRGCSMRVTDDEKAQNMELMVRAPVMDSTLRELAAILDGNEWGEDHCGQMALVLRRAGYVIRDTGED